ncbi:Anucleate primary sterigmata protein A [Talaromyces islandicus]|uniref:Anucleate primary sterigmata protein A n=1 Tax=Talaromyces islandicus TaxID=28573 RepID=A0A0U1LWY2_TALIS|nr:Anucleate primary sterigmata protein A [Talaromyces islandicus]
MEDPFVSSPEGPGASREPHRYSSFDTQLFSLNASSPSQAKRALEAHLAETERRLQEASKLGTALINQQKELSEKLQEVEQQRDEGEVGPELRQKLIELEKEYNEIGRESARAFLAPKRAISGGEGTPMVDLRSPAASAVLNSQASASPSKVSVPSRKQRNQPSGRVHDIEFATEISTSLLAQVRQLQGLLAEREETLKAVNLENSRLELEAEGFSQRIRALDESEQRYKDENWNLETQTHELLNAVKDSQERETKLNSALSSLTAEKSKIERDLEELKQNNGKLLEDQAAAQKAHDSEAHMLRRNLNSGDAERLTLQAKVEELTNQNQELAKAVASMRSRHIEAETPRPVRFETEDTEPDRDTPDNSPPPSPNKQTPRHGHLETETIRSSLGHAHRMIQNLKSNIHREKTEKIELKRMLQEARDELETRRRDNNAPGSGAKRQKIKPDTFKKPLPRSDLLGPGRRGRTEITLDEPDWEDHTSEASPTRTVRSKGSQRALPSRETTDASDVYQTATEAEDAFETANERDTATESEAFQTGAESLAEDSNGDLTETEDRRTPRLGGRRVPSQLVMAKAGNRSSFMSTASTSDDEAPEVHTPVQSQPQRHRVKVNRPGYRRIRPSGEAPMASSINDTSSAQNSPVGSFRHENAVPMGQSLFAELEELGSPGSDGEFGTPTRSAHMLSQPSTPLQTSVILDREISQTPISSRQSTMVDSSTMTDPWEPEVVVAATPAQTPENDSATGTALPASVDSSTQYTPTKISSGPNSEHVVAVPTPPKTIWDESNAAREKDTVNEFQTPVKRHLDVSIIQAEETTPIAPAVRELSLSTVFAEETMPVAAKLPEPEVAVAADQDTEPKPIELSLSSILSEQTEPVPFNLPTPEPVVIVEKVQEIPIKSTPELSISSIYSAQTEPVPVQKRSSPVPTPLSISSIQSTETLPEEPVISKPEVAVVPIVDGPLSRLASAVDITPHKKSSTVFISEDATSQTSRGIDLENQPAEQTLPLSDISGNGTHREAKNIMVQNTDQSAQTILSSKQIDQLLLDRMAARPFTPSEPRSVSGLDSTMNSPGATPKAKTPIVEISSVPTMESTLKRPGSANSVRIGSAGSQHPPLPSDHKQVIAAAQNAQGGAGIMGPPLAPASAYKTSKRPRTPNEAVQAASVRSRSRRESQTSTARSSFSSFVSELDVRFNMHPDDLPQGIPSGTDPRMIQAITQTMIGEYLWKYTRRTVTGDMSNTRHRRYFWVHPYTRTLYWSDQDPSNGGRNESRAKSVAIEAVRVITDDNPYPPGLHRKSLEVLTPGRRIRFTAATSQRHETWFNALSYLLLRTEDERQTGEHEINAEDVEEFNPGIRSHSRQTGPRMSVSSYHSVKTNTSKPRATSSLSIRPPVTPGRVSPAPSSQQNATIRHQSTSSRLSSVLNATVRGSFASIRGRRAPIPSEEAFNNYNAEHDSAEDLRQVIERQEREADRLENVRACCDGKHDVGSLSRTSRFSPAKSQDYAIVVYETIFKRKQPLAPILRSSEVQDEAFGRFWIDLSVPPNEGDKQVVPELVGSSTLIPDLLAQSRGVVLDIGPGTGSQMPFFVPPAANISEIYGPEPCTGLHAQLQKRAVSNGLDGKYHIVPSSVEKRELIAALQKQGVQIDDAVVDQEGIFDTIVCVRVLCSVPDPSKEIADLYSLLRPGGQMLVVEHVGNRFPRKKGGSLLARFMQSVYMWMGYSFFVGNCRLDRDTEGYLRKAADRDGGWAKVDLKQNFTWSTMPYISGTLVKRG